MLSNRRSTFDSDLFIGQELDENVQTLLDIDLKPLHRMQEKLHNFSTRLSIYNRERMPTDLWDIPENATEILLTASQDAIAAYSASLIGKNLSDKPVGHLHV